MKLLSDESVRLLKQLIEQGDGQTATYATGHARRQVAVIDIADFDSWTDTDEPLPVYSGRVARLDTSGPSWSVLDTCFITERRKKSLIPGTSIIGIRTGIYNSQPLFNAVQTCCGTRSSSSSHSHSTSRSRSSRSGFSGIPCDIPICTTLTVNIVDGSGNVQLTGTATYTTNVPELSGGNGWAVFIHDTFFTTSLNGWFICTPCANSNKPAEVVNWLAFVGTVSTCFFNSTVHVDCVGGSVTEDLLTYTTDPFYELIRINRLCSSSPDPMYVEVYFSPEC